MKVNLILVTLIVALLVSGCSGFQSITRATLRDTVFSVEPRKNGVTVMWMTHDDVGAYCTTDPKIAEDMNYFLNAKGHPEVLVDYKSLNVGDDGYNLLNGGCSTEGKDTTNYIVLKIRLPESEATPTPAK